MVKWLWSFVGGAALLPAEPPTRETLRTTCPEAEAMSKALRKAGFTFVGPTIIYAYMESVGMVDDHMAGCFKVRVR